MEFFPSLIGRYVQILLLKLYTECLQHYLGLQMALCAVVRTVELCRL